MFRVDLSSGGGLTEGELTEGELATKRKKWSRKTEDRIERLIEKEYEDDRKAWLRYERMVRTFYWTTYFAPLWAKKYTTKKNAELRSCSLHTNRTIQRHKFGVKCIRCRKKNQTWQSAYCEDCLKEVVPHTWPEMHDRSAFRWYRSGSLWGDDQDDPGFENLIRLMEDG